jgi:hypothetical protein
VCPLSNYPDGYGPDHDIWHLANNRLSLLRDYGLYNVIKSQNVKELPSNVKFEWYFEKGVETTTTDSWGAKLTFVDAREFKKIKTERFNPSKWNRAVLKFLASLPPKTPVVLYWY